MLTPIEQRVIEKAWERMGSAPDPHHPGFFACNHIDSQRWEALRAALFNETD